MTVKPPDRQVTFDILVIIVKISILLNLTIK